MRTRRAGMWVRGGRSRSRLLRPPGFGVVAMLAGLAFMFSPVPASAAPPAQGWTTTQAPLPADAGTGSTNPNVYIASSTCPQANGCITVGYYSDTSGHAWGLIEQQNGTTWTDTEAPQPQNASTSNQGLWLGSEICGFATTPCRAVSCPTTTFCVSVGSYNAQSGGEAPVVETYNGTSWSAAEAPLPSDDNGTFAYLQSVSCTSSTSCVAVGTYENTAAHSVGMIATLSGTTWSVQATPQPPDYSGNSSENLTMVTCASSSSCVAVGDYFTTSNGQQPLIAQLDNGAWSAIRAPLPSNGSTSNTAFDALDDVQCPATSFCVAVGSYSKSTPIFGALVETYSGGTWSASQAPEPSSSANHSASLYGLSCATTASCVAVGLYNDANTHNEGLIDQMTGGNWSAMTAPKPSDAGSGTDDFGDLQTISCPTPSFCMTTGYYVNTSARTAGFVVTWQGGSWTALAAPLPSSAGGTGSQGKSAACYSRVACVVAGWYDDTAGHAQGFLDTWTGAQGYWLDATDGGIFTYPNNAFFGSTGALKLNKPMVGMAATADAQGYWLVASDGGIFSFGDALFHGSRGGQPLNAPIVGMAATPDGKGYWLVASDGGIFSYGDAAFYGSTGNLKLNKPIVGMAATPDGLGYWLVASDGGIFSYGDATFYGSTGSLTLNKPVVGMAASPSGMGYWLVASDGGIFNYGDAAFYGSTGAIVLNKPVVGMAASPSGKGYWLVASDGGIFNYGDAPFQGSAGALQLNAPVVGMAGG